MVTNVYFSENDLNPSLFQNSNLVLTTGRHALYNMLLKGMVAQNDINITSGKTISSKSRF